MTALDWGIVAFAVAMGIWGYRQGLIVGALTLVGFLAGAVAGSRLGPLLLSGGSESPYAPLFAAHRGAARRRRWSRSRSRGSRSTSASG